MAKGRPREFDVDEALDRALEVFWCKGYEGASLPELTKAMGINRPSLYAAFGNKEALFQKVLDRYAEKPARHMCEALREPTARAVVERMLHGTIDLLADPKHPRGCLAVQAALACGDARDSVRLELIARRTRGEAALCRRLEQALADGDLPADADPEALARFVFTIAQGMSVQAAGGTCRTALESIVELALRAWPAAAPARKPRRRGAKA